MSERTRLLKLGGCLMAKRNDLKRMMGENVAKIMGAGPKKYADGYHGGAGQGMSMPAHLQGLVRRRASRMSPSTGSGATPNQPREEFEQGSLQRLATSFKTRGQLQPIRVRWDPENSLFTSSSLVSADGGRRRNWPAWRQSPR